MKKTLIRGADFIANTELTDLAGTVLASPGESCARVPASSLGWLEEQKHVRRAADAAPAPVEPEPAAEESIDFEFPADGEGR